MIVARVAFVFQVKIDGSRLWVWTNSLLGVKFHNP